MTAARELSRFNRFRATAVIQVENDEGILVAYFQLLALMLHIARAKVSVDVNSNLSGRDLAPDSMNLHAIRASEALRAHVNFARAFVGFIFARISITEANAAANGARIGSRADRAARFFDGDVDIGIARPRHTHDAIAYDCFLQFLKESISFGGAAFRCQPL